MKVALFALLLLCLVPVLSFGKARDDCRNCQDCVRGKCRRCKEGHALLKLYSRRYCEKKCPQPLETIWDPVLKTFVCDKKQECTDWSTCEVCLASGSCVKCKKNFALQPRNGFNDNNSIGFNVCVENCASDKCVEMRSKVQVCKPPQVSCDDPGITPKQQSTSSSGTPASSAPSTDPTTDESDWDSYDDPTVDETLEDDY